MSQSNRQNNQLPNNLPQLQNLIKRDPESYKEEFSQQLAHFQALYEIFILTPPTYNKELDDLLIFLAQVAHCYPTQLADYPQRLIDALEKYGTVLNQENRLQMCRALILMRNKNLLEPTTLLPLFFRLLHCQDRKLRKYLETHIIADVKNVNAKSKNMKVNTVLQNFMYNMMKDSNVKATKMSLNIMIELYRKNIWNDAKTVNVIASACFSKVTKVMVTAIQFFLSSDNGNEDSDSDSDDDMPTAKDVAMANRVNKKSRKREKNLEKVKSLMKKKKKKGKAPIYNFSALHLIHDPQGFAEKLFKLLESMNERFEVKLMTLDLVSRLIGIHQLILLNFYPYIKRFIQPHQREVTKILQFAAQAGHELVPPEGVEEVVVTIANNFVTERNSGDVMAVGLNAIRELCARCPLAMSRDLLLDLAQYKSYREKSVMMASRSLIHLFREVNPTMLHKRDKAKPTLADVERKAKQFGQTNAQDVIPGMEALIRNAGDEDSDNDEDDDSEGEWVNISHSEDEAESEVDEDEDEDEGSENEDEDEKDETESQSSEKPQALDPEARRQMAKELLTSTILTDEDFKKMEKLQMQKEVVSVKKGSAKKRKASEALENVAAQVNELVDLSAIENIHKKRRHDKEARLETVRKGQEGRDKFGSRKGKMNPFASTSNKEKRKTKNFMMLKHKIKRTKKKSFKEQQFSYRKALEKTRKRMLKK